MKHFIQSLFALLFFVALYAVPEVSVKEPIVHHVGEPTYFVVHGGVTYAMWAAPMFSDQKMKREIVK